jgi:hypothetical protein
MLCTVFAGANALPACQFKLAAGGPRWPARTVCSKASCVLGQTSRVQRPARRTCQPRDRHVLPAPSPITGAPRKPSRPSRCRATKVDHALAPVARQRRSPSGRSCVHRCSGPAGFHGRPPVRLSCGMGRRGVTGVAKHRHASQCFDGIRHIDRSIRIRHIARSLARSTIRIRSSSLDHSLARSTIRSLARPFASLSPRLVPLHFASLRFAWLRNGPDAAGDFQSFRSGFRLPQWGGLGTAEYRSCEASQPAYLALSDQALAEER